MSQGENSASVTAGLVVLLCVGNYVTFSHLTGWLNPLLTWPLGFALCCWIASRFLHGHNKP